MKTKKHITLSLAVLLLLLALLAACNADASAGLFRQIADSQAPIGIVYRQLLGLDTIGTTTTLYYRTNEGIYKTDLTTRTKMQSSVKDAIIQASYYADSDTVLYITNDSNEVKGTDNSTYSPTNAAIVTTNDRFVLKNLYANGMVMLKGDATSDSTKTQFVLTKYDNNSPLVFPVMDGYDLDSVLQMTGYEDMAASTANPMLVSFVDNPTSGADPSYLHYYYVGTSPATPISGLSSKRFAAFTVISGNLFILTADGDLYGGTSASMNLLYEGSKRYDPNTFFYGVTDGTTTHLISKTNTKSEDLFIYSFDGINITTASIDEGYAKYLANADIVSALYLGSTAGVSDTLLVATNDNGLYKISINYANANADSSLNGTSTKSEEYDFDTVL